MRFYLVLFFICQCLFEVSAQNYPTGILDIENHPSLYRNVGHNIKVVAHGYDSTHIEVDNGNLKKIEGSNYLYVLTPIDTGVCNISIYGVMTNGDVLPPVAFYQFNVEDIPSPELFINEVSSGNNISLTDNSFSLTCGYRAGIALFDEFEVIGYRILPKKKMNELNSGIIPRKYLRKKKCSRSIIVEARVKNNKNEISSVKGVWLVEF